MSGATIADRATLVVAGGELLLRVGSERSRLTGGSAPAPIIVRCIDQGARYEGTVSLIDGATVTAILTRRDN